MCSFMSLNACQNSASTGWSRFSRALSVGLMRGTQLLSPVTNHSCRTWLGSAVYQLNQRIQYKGTQIMFKVFPRIYRLETSAKPVLLVSPDPTGITND